MGLIRNIALRFMGEAGGKAERDKASTSSCSTGFSCDPPFDGVQCSLNGLFCAWDCGGTIFVCQSQFINFSVMCQPTWTCDNGYECGTDSQSIFLCGSAFAGCETRVTCKGKYMQCEDGECRSLSAPGFDCMGFACGASEPYHNVQFTCSPPGPGVNNPFSCTNSGKSFDCHHAYSCSSTNNPEYTCHSRFICADVYNCINVEYSCDIFDCGSGDVHDRFVCEVFDDECRIFN